MKVILDTNVFVSAVFFGGIPYKILDSWRRGMIGLVVSTEILDEYRCVGEELSARYDGVSLLPMLELVTVHAQLVDSPALPSPVCIDGDDDKFIACAVASGTKLIVSGDRHLLDVSGYQDISVMNPRTFANRYLQK